MFKPVSCRPDALIANLRGSLVEGFQHGVQSGVSDYMEACLNSQQ
jgi:hypothetical protein